MRRRAGADIVEIDTFAGTCRFWYVEPQVIDFDAIDQASLDASYALVQLRLNIEGKVVDEGGRSVLVTSAGQRFELELESELEGKLKGRVHLHTVVSEWDGERARLTVEFGHASASR